MLVAKSIKNTRRQFALRISGSGITHHTLCFAQLLPQQQRVIPVESRCLAHTTPAIAITFVATINRKRRGRRTDRCCKTFFRQPGIRPSFCW